MYSDLVVCCIRPRYEVGGVVDWSDMNGFTKKMTAMVACLAVIAYSVFNAPAYALEFPDLAALPETALAEITAEDRISEVLDQNISYRALFDSVNNPDVQLQKYVRPGEDLQFQATWRGLPAGSIRLTAKRVAKLRNRPVFVFELNVKSNDFLSAFYPIATNINSYVDAESGKSYLIRRRVSERNRSYQDRLEFKYDSRLPNGLPDPVSKYSMVNETGQEIANLPFPIPGNMQDMVSIIYYIRGMKLKNVGDSCHLLLGGRKKPVLSSITVIGEEVLTIPSIGTFDCLIVEPQTDGTNLSGNLVATRGGEKIWLERNSLIPVQASAELPKPMGAVIATLIQAENSDLHNFRMGE